MASRPVAGGRRRCPPSPRRRPSTSRRSRPAQPQHRARADGRLLDGPAARPCSSAEATARARVRRTRTPSWSTRCAASRAPASSPASTPTRPGSGSTRPTRWTRSSPTRRLRGVRGLRQRRADASPYGLQKAGYTTGFVGKFLNRVRVRPRWRARASAAARAGASSTRCSGRRTTAGTSGGPTIEDGVLNVRRVPRAARRRRRRKEKDSAVRRHGHPADYALDFIDDHGDDSAGRGSSRSRPTPPTGGPTSRGCLPGRPCSSRPTFRDRPSRAAGRAGTVACWTAVELGVEDLPGFGDDRRRQPPRAHADGTAGRAGLGHALDVSRRAATERVLRDRARMVQSIDRTVQQDPARPGPRRTPTSCSRPTTASTTASSDSGVGKGSAYDSDIRVPLLVVRPGRRVPASDAEVVSNIDLALDLRGPGRDRDAAALPVRAARWSRRSKTPPWTGGGTPSSSTRGPASRRRPGLHRRRRCCWCRRTSRSAAVTGRARSATDLDPGSPNVTEYVWEFYEYAAADFERTNDLRRSAASGRSSGVLTRKLKASSTAAPRSTRGAGRAPCRRDLTR